MPITTIDRAACIDIIVSFVRTNYVVDQKTVIPLDESLVEIGILDSYGVIELVTFLEKHFQIVVSSEDLTKEKFGSIYLMADYVMGQLARAA